MPLTLRKGIKRKRTASFIFLREEGRSSQIKKVQCYEPATMKYLGFFPALSSSEVHDRVEQARKAQKIWAKNTLSNTKSLYAKYLHVTLERQWWMRLWEKIMTTCEKITWLLSEGEKWLKPEYRSSGRAMFFKKSRVEFHPLGVIGAIVSWNYPFHNIFNPMLAAVFSGNSIVIKVSENASWSGLFYFRIIQAALAAVGAPENLVDIITGFAEAGEALVSSVDKIIFVGSPGVGKMIMSNASDTLIPVTLELGGKDSFIVCEDVDVSHVAQIAVRAVLQSSGQNCAGAERFYVHRDIYSSFVSEVAKIIKSVSAGPPFAGRYDMGAICLQEHSDKLQNFVNDALNKGAEIVARGSFGHLGEGAVDQFFPPTVLVNVNHTMKLMQEETFGPIMPLMKFSTDEEAVKLANDFRNTGLGCAVFLVVSAEPERLLPRYIVELQLLMTLHQITCVSPCHFGGVKDSGFGRWWPYIKTTIPKPIQYPVGENGFEFQQSLVEALYGLNIWDRLQALINVLKILSEKNSGSSKGRKD
ncbi:hypothetical protein OIU84_019343 [Salix udensis]|uniref:Aldehyde dehydrogenase domain-containing protein n=1 Tax=Salix udensis TaxID=889485 RepID=A0AAD6L0H3_9ROSI|nr:hypothetical protein OIU84_019343 [Salix udensis]